MSYYRLYFLSEAGGIGSVEELQCDSDDDADALVHARGDGAAMELWNLSRLVRAYPRDPKTPSHRPA